MKLNHLHTWNISPKDAVALQGRLRDAIQLSAPGGFSPKLIAGADISANRFSKTVYAAVVAVSFPELEVVETVAVASEAAFPYVPGLLAFREIPAAAAAFEKLRCRPDAIIFDGHGIAHPRRMGLASHAGLILDCPTLGCAKSLLVGSPREDLPQEAGATVPIVHNGETIGAALRTRNRVKPVYVSPGHKMDIETAVSLVKQCCAGYRLPEPTRLAHLAANELRKQTASTTGL